jgi:hypothetical protein
MWYVENWAPEPIHFEITIKYVENSKVARMQVVIYCNVATAPG